MSHFFAVYELLRFLKKLGNVKLYLQQLEVTEQHVNKETWVDLKYVIGIGSTIDIYDIYECIYKCNIKYTIILHINI